MTTKNDTRDKYFSNQIFKNGDIVIDSVTGEKSKILDRGSNYVTVVQESDGQVVKKWLNQIIEDDQETNLEKEAVLKQTDFVVQEDGQIQLFGHITSNFDHELSEFLIEQFDEFDDLYSKHQIIKCLDYAIGSDDNDYAYNLLERVSEFYRKQNLDEPIILEALKTDIERKRLAEIIATVADVKPSKTYYQTVVQSIKSLKSKYQSRKQWEVLWPLFKLAREAGMDGIMQNLPYTFEKPSSMNALKESILDTTFYETMYENLDLLVDDLDWEDYDATFLDEEFSPQILTETLTLTSRNKLSHKMSQKSDYLDTRRTRALLHAATSQILMNRARRMAETMLKRRMFKKDPTTLNRQEHERFEAGAFSRRALVSRLAQRLITKVRALQSHRLHPTTSSDSNITHHTPQNLSGAA